ncbi:MAG: cytochrome c [Gammaproteobacteria bacterium]|nr:cytochrome c [Gammaproteobacteria bacterium]MDT8371622.1 cytochrome c [Gammaproteobacteria bacterium]
MSMLIKTLLIGFCLLHSVSCFAQDNYQKLGKKADGLSQQAQWNLTILPSGDNLPKGGGTAVQGAKLFAVKCAGCHGPEGIGASAEPLVGEVGSLTSDYPEKTVNSYWRNPTTLFDYIRRAMPTNAPFSLTHDEIYALCAYIFNKDDIFLNNVELNQETLPKVTMPNHSGFVAIYPSQNQQNIKDQP